MLGTYACSSIALSRTPVGSVQWSFCNLQNQTKLALSSTQGENSVLSQVSTIPTRSLGAKDILSSGCYITATHIKEWYR